MAEVIKQTEIKSARKRYHCDGSDFLINEFNQGLDIKFTFAELRIISDIKNYGSSIPKGTSYIRQFNKDGGDFWEWLSRKDVFQIIMKYRMFDTYN